MEKINKKGFVFRLSYFIIVILVIILLFFLIKNNWNVTNAFKDMFGLLRLK